MELLSLMDAQSHDTDAAIRVGIEAVKLLIQRDHVSGK